MDVVLIRQTPSISSARGGHWRTSMDLPGAFDLIHARRLMEDFDWISRKPAPEIIISNNDSKNSTLELSSNNHLLIYFPFGEKITLDINKTTSKNKLHSYWMNPRTGEKTKAGISRVNNSIDINPPSSGRGCDWILIIQ